MLIHLLLSKLMVAIKSDKDDLEFRMDRFKFKHPPEF